MNSSSIFASSCPYLHTIDRSRLDLDGPYLCSVSLESRGVYACLRCGKYLQGRGRNSYAYNHSLDHDPPHKLFINLENGRFFMLPENIEILVDNNALDDIRDSLRPSFSMSMILKLRQAADRDERRATFSSRLFDGTEHIQGVMGLNILHDSNYFNVAIHAFSSLPDMRDFFLSYQGQEIASESSSLVHSLSLLIQKMWIRKPLRSRLAPRAFSNLVALRSNKRFTPKDTFTEKAPGTNSNMMRGINIKSYETISNSSSSIPKPDQWISWLLHMLRQELEAPTEASVYIDDLEVESRKRIKTENGPLPSLACERKERNQIMRWFQGALVAASVIQTGEPGQFSKKLQSVPFTMLTLDIVTDSESGSVLRLQDLLSKYDGVTETLKAVRQSDSSLLEVPFTYSITSLPKYLIIHLNRFIKTSFGYEKKTGVVGFPIRELKMPTTTGKEGSSSFDLRAAICQPQTSQDYVAFCWHDPTREWYEIHGIHTKKSLEQFIAMNEVHFLFYEKIEK